MTKARFLFSVLGVLLACRAAWAQRVQNSDIFFLYGAAPISSRAISGSNVTINGQTARTSEIGYGYQIARFSAASLWLEVVAPATSFATSTSSVPGSVNDDLFAFTAGARVMVPLQSRISVYGVLAGGGGFLQSPVIQAGPTPSITSNESAHGMFVPGGGLDLRLVRFLSIRVEARDFITAAGLSGSAGHNHILPALGIGWHF